MVKRTFTSVQTKLKVELPLETSKTGKTTLNPRFFILMV
jgi:hypothetical protein